ncbi:MAG TPA: DUF2142 domain-containing protein [Thermoflexia bacterium]|nr:DUF2142 domain-containing protein [Thermoflexia bacterium]
MKTKNILIIILLLFVVLGAIYSVIVPPFEASDEKWHYPMVKYIADNGALPVQEPGVETPWRQEGSQPPLYYALAAAATFWIDTSDMDAVRRINPYVDAGDTPDGNVNLVVHNPALETFPWRGTVLAIHLIRFLSVLMGAAAVYLTYLIAREVLPDRPALALGAAAIHAFTPMYIFISASVNNDALTVPLCSLALLMLLRLLRQPDPLGFPKPKGSLHLLLGIALGLAALTKTSALPLTVLTALVVIIRAARNRSWREFFVGGLATLLPFLAISGWWFWRNLQLYGDIFGLDVFIEILGQRDVPADLAQLWRERHSFLAGYWGNFGGLNVPMPAWTYTALNIVAVMAALSLITHYVSRFEPFAIRHSQFAICLLWGLSILISWSQWASVTWSSQGRLVFSAIQTWSLLLALGIAVWFPRRWGRWAVAAFAAFLLALTVLAPWLWIRPAYALSKPLTDAQVAAIPRPMGTDFGGTMKLLGYDLETEAVKPGGQAAVTLYWEALAPTGQDYAVFVHLLGEHELLAAQRDTLPGLGLLSTTWLEPGYRWADRYVIQVPETAYAPDAIQIEVGLYDVTTGARLHASSGGDNARFGEIELCARAGEVPNPISINFGDRMELAGYKLDRRAAQPGEPVTLTLYWRGLREMEANYTISTQLIDPAQRKAAQHDGWPLDGVAPTTIWKPGELVVDTRALTIFPDTPPGAYDLRVSVYLLEEDGIVHLPVISIKGEMLFDYQLLTKVRVMP